MKSETLAFGRQAEFFPMATGREPQVILTGIDHCFRIVTSRICSDKQD
jgi:hypothetical protein